MKKILIATLLFTSMPGMAFDIFGSKFELKKYYKDPNSAAALMMGGTYAGVVETFNSIDACMQMKKQVEIDDKNIGYTNSRFVCDKK